MVAAHGAAARLCFSSKIYKIIKTEYKAEENVGYRVKIFTERGNLGQNKENIIYFIQAKKSEFFHQSNGACSLPSFSSDLHANFHDFNWVRKRNLRTTTLWKDDV